LLGENYDRLGDIRISREREIIKLEVELGAG